MVRVVEKLSDSHEVAKLMAAERVATCMRVFARIKAGIITTPEQAKAALAERRHPDDGLPESWSGFDEAMRRYLAGPPGPREMEQRRRHNESMAARFEAYGEWVKSGEQPAARPAGETISQASEAWYAELTRDKSTAPRDTTLGGHRLRVRAFVEKSGDLPLTEVTRAVASDFLAGLKVKNRTRNAYATTLNTESH